MTAERWKQLKAKPDAEIAAAFESLDGQQDTIFSVPTSLLDFETTPGLKQRDRDPFYGLIRIREELSASVAKTPYRLKFPLHTYGCFLYLQKTNRLTEANSLFPFEEADFLNEFVNLFKQVPGPGLALAGFGLIDKYLGNQLTNYQKRLRLDPDEAKRLQAMDAEKELIH
ncbi:MAG: hypothetical protein AAF215_12780 [Cyanobacteria bacterium P01_A01_bin.123]